MSMSIRLVLNPREIYDLLGYLNDLPSLPPDLVDVPSKLRAALQSISIDNQSVFSNYPMPQSDGLWNIQGPRTQSELDYSTTLTPRRLFSPSLPLYSSPHHGTFTAPSQHQGFGESDHISLSNSAPHPILGRRERSSSPYSTPRNQICLELGGELGLAGPDEAPQICDAGANGNTEENLGHAGDSTNDAGADGDADTNGNAASDQGIENAGIWGHGRDTL